MYNLIEDYLDRLTVPLVRRLPYHERQRIRQEMRDHLLERVQEITAQGVSADEAVGLAIRSLERRSGWEPYCWRNIVPSPGSTGGERFSCYALC